MLENNEKIEGVDLSAVFKQMLRELPWASLRTYIQTNPQLLKVCTFGGHRFDPQQRQWFEKNVLREAERGQYADATSSGVFASWYPVRTELHDHLEDYFHSDEYKKYREDNGLTEDDYVLPPEKFNEYFSVSQLDAWRILLCFSPLKFSAEQAKKVLDGAVGNVELLTQLKELQTANSDLQKKIASLTADAEKNRQRQKEDADELLETKKQLRQSKNDQDTIARKLESALAEIKRLQQKTEQHDTNLAARENELKANLEREVSRAQNDLARIQTELQTWKNRYEEQKLVSHKLEEETREAQRLQKDASAEVSNLAAKNEKLTSFADLVLSRIDWPKVGTAMKLSPTIRRNFNSLVKKLNYEEDMTLTIEGELPEFWNQLIESEKRLVDKLAKSNSEEVMNGNVDSYWADVEALFGEAQTNLEARVVLLEMLYGIFFQEMTTEELEKPTIPTGKKKA